jgi:hypothetical protein
MRSARIRWRLVLSLSACGPENAHQRRLIATVETIDVLDSATQRSPEVIARVPQELPRERHAFTKR